MAVVTLPLTFQNSFWSRDYRAGLEVLFGQLEKGVSENEEIVTFIRSRAAAETAVAATLSSATPAGTAFDTDAGASLPLAFRGLRDESVAQGQLHTDVANDLRNKIAEPFADWANGYKERLHTTRSAIVDGYLRAYENAQGDVSGLKNVYVTKTHRADELEDDVRFAPITQPAGDIYTSPSLRPQDKRAPRTPARQPTVSERITARLREFRLNASTGTHPESGEEHKPEVQFDADADAEEKGTPKLDKGKARAVDPDEGLLASPPPMDPPLPPAKIVTDLVPPAPAQPAAPVVVAGVSFAAHELSELLTRAKAEMPLRAVRFPLLGEYQEAFSGEEFTAWLRQNVKQYEGDLDRCEDAARELTEKLGLLRRLGEFGNEYEDVDDAFYQFRPKAFNLEVPKAKDEKLFSPIEKNFSPLAEGVVKRTATFANLVTKALANNPTGEAPYVRARREAESADQEYRVAVRKLDRQRLGLEERIEDTLKNLQKWELDRLRAVKTVLTQYHMCLQRLSQGMAQSLDKSSTLIASYQPESDMRGLIEQYRTGPFYPTAHVYESVAHDESDVVFGIDLRKWADAGMWNPNGQMIEEKKDVQPPVLLALLGALTEAYGKLATDAEKRKTWIYEVPLVAVHHLRETLNAVPPMQDIPDDVLAKYDAPVVASAVKLWFLELDPPICMYEGWDDFRKLYPTVGVVKSEDQPSEEQHIMELQAALQKLPRVHLIVLDTLVKHLKDLIDNTKEDEEPNDVFLTKLSLGMGRTILRPKVETKFSIQDRHPTLLFMDLLSKYSEILPPTIAKKKRESERKVPIRKRTRPTDMRMSRSRISAGADLKELHTQQLAQRGMKPKPQSPPPVSTIPTITKQAPTVNVPASASEAAAVTLAPSNTIVTDEPDSLTTPTAASPSPVESEIKDGRTPTASKFSSIPPPPPLETQPSDFAAIPPPPPLSKTPEPAPKAATPVDVEVRPSFKEPPPEVDDLPPRPQFKEPPPEPESPRLPMPNFAEPVSPPTLPMPSFTEPPEEPISPPAHSPPARSPHASSPSATSPSIRGASPRSGSSRDPSPNKASLSRRSSVTPTTTQVAAAVRGPRAAGRMSRTGGGSVSSMVSNLNNRASVSGTSLARPGSPANSVGGRSPSRPVGSHVKRSSASRTSMFERRTMASDAEEEIVQ